MDQFFELGPANIASIPRRGIPEGNTEAKLAAVARRGEHRQEIRRIVGRAGGNGPDGRQETQ